MTNTFSKNVTSLLKRNVIVSLSLMVLSSLNFACATQKGTPHTGHVQGVQSGAFSKEMHAEMSKMHKDMMKAEMTGDPNHDFAAMMIPHHQGAIDMAEIYLKYGNNSELTEMSKNIISSQTKEIEQMKRLLRDYHENNPEAPHHIH